MTNRANFVSTPRENFLPRSCSIQTGWTTKIAGRRNESISGRIWAYVTNSERSVEKNYQRRETREDFWKTHFSFDSIHCVNNFSREPSVLRVSRSLISREKRSGSTLTRVIKSGVNWRIFGQCASIKLGQPNPHCACPEAEKTLKRCKTRRDTLEHQSMR